MNNLKNSLSKGNPQPPSNETKSQMRVLVENLVQEYLSILNIHNLFEMVECLQKQINEIDKKVTDLEAADRKEEFVINPNLTEFQDEMDTIKRSVSKVEEDMDILAEVVSGLQSKQNLLKKKEEKK
jgi:uncharacterized protein YllA (UPF0747 family)